MRSPGSGTFIVEAAIATLTGPGDKLLVLVNGAYGERMAAIARRLNRPVEILSWPEDRSVAPPSSNGHSTPIGASPMCHWSIAKPRRDCSIRWRRRP
jgi:hypothetical protein